ncbi:6-hydroxymethylpterin diphosphokinase MptE-like protein [Bacillus sp. JJ1521]|uniref:6-hydroxymethylpterin diphosphokinase MptE-like protein n=1 Tax=Bacillus sp. JJ1521 TaxID=3122957 RepID=UPI002FFE1FB4
MSIRELLKSNRQIYKLAIQIGEMQYLIKRYVRAYLVANMTFNIKRFLRVHNFTKNNPYENLKGLKNKHKGERCFIVATGPSLTIEDLEKLRNETTISMNSICLAFEDTDWRPTYYGIQDENVYKRMEKYIEELDCEGKFLSQSILEQLKIKMPDDYYIFPLYFLKQKVQKKRYHTKFSNDIFSVVYSGYTITYCLLQIAAYMGFKEIYLLGTDCHYSSNMRHHFKDYDYVDSTFASAGDMMTGAYRVAKEYADQNNIKIYNATRGGRLEVFKRVDLDEVLMNKTK